MVRRTSRERLAVTGLDHAAALRPQPVGDRAGDLALAGAGRTDQPQEPRPARLLHVQQRAGDRVDRLAVQLGRVDELAVGKLESPTESTSRSISPGARAPSRSPSAPTSLIRCRAAAMAEAMRVSLFVGWWWVRRSGGSKPPAAPLVLHVPTTTGVTRTGERGLPASSAMREPARADPSAER
jgi:hypothetical protein